MKLRSKKGGVFLNLAVLLNVTVQLYRQSTLV